MLGAPVPAFRGDFLLPENPKRAHTLLAPKRLRSRFAIPVQMAAGLAAWLTRWRAKYPKLTDWVEDNIEQTWTFYRLPRQHHKHLKSTNMLERLNEEIRRRTQVVRIFPNHDSCLRLIRALAVGTHEDSLEANRYPNMDYLKELKKEELRKAA